MKRVLGGMVVAAALSGSAFAADLGARTYTKAPAVAPISNWSGLYVGGNLGYGWGDGNTDVSFLPSPVEFRIDNNTTLGARSSGAIGGAQLGYNWQIGSLVTGLEADIQGSGIKGSARAIPTVLGTAFPDPRSVLSSETKAFVVWHGARPCGRRRHTRPSALWHGRSGLWPCRCFGKLEVRPRTSTRTSTRKCQQDQSWLDRRRRRGMDVRAQLVGQAGVPLR